MKASGALHVHMGRLESGTLKTGNEVHASIDEQRRRRLKANHSATHLLHKAMRDVLGDHVTQKGSLVAPDKLRFDFSNPKALSPEEIQSIENKVNRSIRRNASTTTQLMDPEEGIKAGALALFGEKYGDEVRVVTMGDLVEDAVHSVELCGGTHVDRAGEIGYFKIISESSVSSGVRRLEAITGQAAQDYASGYVSTVSNAAALLKVKPDALVDKIATLLSERKTLSQQVKDLRKSGGAAASGAASTTEVINGTKVLFEVHEDLPAKDLRGEVDRGKKQLGSGVVAIFTQDSDKVGVAIGVTADLTDRISAVDIVRAASEALGGKGGGRPDMAQAGGPNANSIPQAQDAVRTIVGG